MHEEVEEDTVKLRNGFDLSGEGRNDGDKLDNHSGHGGAREG